MTLATDRVPSHEFELVRLFDAPRDLVFKAWAHKRYVAPWWGVDGATNSRCDLDVRPCGAWRTDMRTASGVVSPNCGFFLEVVTNERLVDNDILDPESVALAGAPRGPIVYTEDVEAGGTKVSLVVRADSAADRDRLLEQPMREGMEQGLDRLGRLLGELTLFANGASTRSTLQ